MSWLLVAVGGAGGAAVRYLLDRAVTARVGGRFPWGILAVNLAGSFVLGLLLGLARGRGVADAVLLLLGTGFCGAFTTYSTFAHDTVDLLDGARRLAVLNAVGSLAGGLAAVALGLLLGGLLG